MADNTTTILVALCGICSAFTPFSPAAGWTYNLEAAREQGCTTFVSSNTENTKAKLQPSHGSSAEFTLVDSNNHDGAFYLKLANGRYLSYAGDCSNTVVDTWPEAGINQEFRLVATVGAENVSDSVTFMRRLVAVGRASCGVGTGGATVSFSLGTCDNGVLGMRFEPPADVSTFRLQPVRNNNPHYDKPPNSGSCADPFAWYCPSCSAYALVCTGGDLALYSSRDIGTNTTFAANGVALGGNIPGWATNGNRWAPESIDCTTSSSLDNKGSAAGASSSAPYHVLFFADVTGSDGKHRVGWAMSSAAQHLSGSFSQYSRGPLNLGETAQGEIDPHIFRDADDRTYLLWKTDDNSIGMPYTRLWAVEVGITPGNVTLLGNPKTVMNSTGLWWVSSFIKGGSLIEGPELLRHEELGYYYLFFAAGKYCQDSYSEGVARSRSIFGPWEKMPVPLLSTGMTGYSGGRKQVGPGHASFVGPTSKGQYFAVYHASMGENCDRHAFVEELKFDSASAWPFIDFGSMNPSP